MYGNDISVNNDGHVFKDCFVGQGRFDADWERFRNPLGNNQRDITLIFYQHGNLSIFRDDKNVETKLKVSEGNSLLSEITEQWTDNKIPLFVAEGTGSKKKESIQTSKYLSTIYYEILPTLLEQDVNLVIYGWGMGDQEAHLVEQIFGKRNASKKKKGKVAISVYENNQTECHRIFSMIKTISTDIEIEFFDSQSSGCWNNL